MVCVGQTPLTTKEMLTLLCERQGLSEVLDRFTDVVADQSRHLTGDRHRELDILTDLLEQATQQALTIEKGHDSL